MTIEQRTIHDLARQIIDHTATIMLTPQWQHLGARVLPIQRLARELLQAEPIPVSSLPADPLGDGLEACIAGGYLMAAEGQIHGAAMMIAQIPPQEMASLHTIGLIDTLITLTGQTVDSYRRATIAIAMTEAGLDTPAPSGHRPFDGDGDMTNDLPGDEVAA